MPEAGVWISLEASFPWLLPRPWIKFVDAVGGEYVGARVALSNERGSRGAWVALNPRASSG